MFCYILFAAITHSITVTATATACRSSSVRTATTTTTTTTTTATTKPQFDHTTPANAQQSASFERIAEQSGGLVDHSSQSGHTINTATTTNSSSSNNHNANSQSACDASSRRSGETRAAQLADDLLSGGRLVRVVQNATLSVLSANSQAQQLARARHTRLLRHTQRHVHSAQVRRGHHLDTRPQARPQRQATAPAQAATAATTISTATTAAAAD